MTDRNMKNAAPCTSPTGHQWARGGFDGEMRNLFCVNCGREGDVFPTIPDFRRAARVLEGK